MKAGGALRTFPRRAGFMFQEGGDRLLCPVVSCVLLAVADPEATRGVRNSVGVGYGSTSGVLVLTPFPLSIYLRRINAAKISVLQKYCCHGNKGQSLALLVSRLRKTSHGGRICPGGDSNARWHESSARLCAAVRGGGERRGGKKIPAPATPTIRTSAGLR